MTVHQFLDLIAKASIMTIITVNVGGPLKDIAKQAREVSECVESVYFESLPKEPSAKSRSINEALRAKPQTAEERQEESHASQCFILFLNVDLIESNNFLSHKVPDRRADIIGCSVHGPAGQADRHD